MEITPFLIEYKREFFWKKGIREPQFDGDTNRTLSRIHNQDL
ncbi:hypothetical protein BGS_0221 [Beggiatoa sp. SS]|nr:hypothetical protein BGS_0221 [Beggiatoa sp. SS]